MADGELRYPPEIAGAVMAIKNAASGIDEEMNKLKLLANGLVASSNGAAIQGYDEAQQVWWKDGDAHTQALQGVAGAAGESYDTIVAFDQDIARRFR